MKREAPHEYFDLRCPGIRCTRIAGLVEEMAAFGISGKTRCDGLSPGLVVDFNRLERCRALVRDWDHLFTCGGCVLDDLGRPVVPGRVGGFSDRACVLCDRLQHPAA